MPWTYSYAGHSACCLLPLTINCQHVVLLDCTPDHSLRCISTFSLSVYSAAIVEETRYARIMSGHYVVLPLAGAVLDCMPSSACPSFTYVKIEKLYRKLKIDLNVASVTYNSTRMPILRLKGQRSRSQSETLLSVYCMCQSLAVIHRHITYSFLFALYLYPVVFLYHLDE